MSRYWVRTNHKLLGPFSASQLKQLARQNRLKSHHSISADQKTWQVASSIKGLEFDQEDLSTESDSPHEPSQSTEPDDEYALTPLEDRENSSELAALLQDETVVGLTQVQAPAIPPPAPVPRQKSKRNQSPLQKLGMFVAEKAFQFIAACVTLCILIGIAVVMEDSLQSLSEPEPDVPAVTPVAAHGNWMHYVDPKSRFECDIPPGWTPEDIDKGTQRSDLIISRGKHQIRITVRNTSRRVMKDSDQQEMIEEMKGTSSRQCGARAKMNADV